MWVWSKLFLHGIISSHCTEQGELFLQIKNNSVYFPCNSLKRNPISLLPAYRLCLWKQTQFVLVRKQMEEKRHPREEFVEVLKISQESFLLPLWLVLGLCNKGGKRHSQQTNGVFHLFQRKVTNPKMTTLKHNARATERLRRRCGPLEKYCIDNICWVVREHTHHFSLFSLGYFSSYNMKPPCGNCGFTINRLEW